MVFIKDLYDHGSSNHHDYYLALKGACGKAASLGQGKGLACALLVKAALNQLSQACEDIATGAIDESRMPGPVWLEACSSA